MSEPVAFIITFIYKNMNKILITLLGLCYCFSSWGENNGRALSFKDDSLHVSIACLTDRIIHIRVIPEGSAAHKSLIRSLSLSENDKATFPTQTEKQQMLLQTPRVTVVYSFDDKNIRFIDTPSQKVILQEKAKSFHRQRIAGEDAWQVEQTFQIHEDEALYGLGQYQEGVMNYRGKTVNLVQANMEIVNPFLLSSRRYGILWDNYSKTVFNDDAEGASFWSEVADGIDYYFIYGTDLDDVIKGYHELTGPVPMFPKSAFGFWQSRERYKSFAELTSVVEEYRKRNIPIDNIVQDWEYWGGREHWNALKFDTAHFNHPQEAIQLLHDKHKVQLMLSVWPGFGKATEIYQELEQAGALFDEPTWAGYKVMDIYNPEAQQLFWKYLYKDLYSTGVDAWWLDATEPSFKEGFTQKKQEEKTKSAGQTHIGSFHRYLNVYSLFLTKTLYENLRRQSNKRVCILTRSAFAGQQQYATVLWSGDITASWETFKKQIPAGLNMCMTGFPYWTTDIGGFFVSSKNKDYSHALTNPSYKELYLRWFQQSAFSPLFRAHGTDIPREIWQFGEPGDVFYDGQLKMIKLRYSLLSYIYSYAWQATSHSKILMRSLIMDFPEDANVRNAADAYMFGPSLLIRPITSPMYYAEGKPIEAPTTTTSLYLPAHKGKYWYDFYNHQLYEGGQNMLYETPLDIIPIFIKGGSILPFNQVHQYAGEKKDSVLDIHIYAGGDAHFDLYEDDNVSYEYEKRMYSLIHFYWNDAENTLKISDKEGKFTLLDKRMFNIKIFRPQAENKKTSIQTKEVEYGNKAVSMDFK